MGSPVQAAVQVMTADELLAQIAREMPQQPGEAWIDYAKRIELERVVRSGEQGIELPAYNWNTTPEESAAFDKIVRETTADGAWQNWSDGAKTAQGAAAPEPVAKAAPGAAIKKAGASGASLGGLLSVPLPTWVAAAAPLLGVAVGVGLYELSPEFWTKVSQTLLPWCYEDSQAMPVITDEEGNTYLDKEAVEALKRVFDEEGIGGEEGRTSDLETAWSQPVKSAGKLVFESSGTLITKSYYGNSAITVAGTREYYVVAGSSPGSVIYKETSRSSGTTTYSSTELSFSYTYDGRTVYFTRGVVVNSGYTLVSATSINTPYAEPSYDDAAKIAWTIVYGSEVSKYVAGTSKWSGTQVDISQLPITEAYTDPTKSDTRDFIPAALPTTPGQSVSPETNPDPTKNEDPEAQISPYINPSINPDQYPSGSESTGEDGEELDKSAPIPLPYPSTQDTPSPDDNPSDKPKKKWPAKFVDIIPPIDSGDITFSPVPTIGSPTDGGVGGLVSVYNPTYSELQAFSNWLWVTYQDATIDKIWNNPFDGIISLYEIYATPTEGARKYIKSGFLVSTVECATLPQRYIEINCGTAVFPEYYGNYLDYSPYSKAMCYLPFIGIVELNVDDIVGHAVNITYRVDVYTGGCIAIITCAREGSNVAMYQFSGNCSVQLPIAGGTQSAIRAAQISAGAYQNAYHIAGLAGLYGGIASGLLGSVGGAISGLGQWKTSEQWGNANQVSQSVSAKSSVQHSGQFGESYGAMGHKKPYMIIKRPVQVIVPGYQQVYGFQAHKMVQIGACTGFLRCRAVHVLSAQATDEEKSMIEQLLVSGVYVTE